ncbi:MAG: toxic anion resistance protein [Ardenticatenaceae bacterium]|nr:toxic anion resistance protein [Ardenticatenaceae bacterium]
MEDLELAPPETLNAPKPVQKVEVEQADGLMKLREEEVSELDVRAEKFIADVMTTRVNTDEFTDQVNAIHNLGNKEIRASASVSNRMLDRPAAAMQDGVFDDKSPISKALVDLRRTVEDLDPSRQGDLFQPKRLFGIIPFGDKLRDYFLRYQSSQKHIDAILNSLHNGQDELRMDNAALEEEKVNLWAIMTKLQQYIYLGRRIDTALTQRVAELEISDPEKARIVKEEMLFYVRQKVQDLLTQLAVSIQGYLALDMVRKNNLELIKGVDRASTTTVSALRTAIIVAQALANQKLVLDQINALNTTTSNLIHTTSEMMKRQTAEVYKQASSSTIEIDKLKKSFDNIYFAMDSISEYKLQALDVMDQTINALSDEITKSKTYLDRVRQSEAIEATSDVDFTKPPADSDNSLEL